MNREELEACLGQEQTFKLQILGSQMAFDSGLVIAPERFKIQSWVDMEERLVLRNMFTLATQEEEVFDYPADWWEALKDRWFPCWLKKRFPVKKARVWAVHKFPELAIPEEFVGRESVHFRVVDEKKLERALKEA